MANRIDNMSRRIATIWFPLLTTDWFTLRRPALRGIPFVLTAKDHGRMVITAANAPALEQGIAPGMPVADARALLPSLQVIDDRPGLAEKLLQGLAAWCIRFTPIAAVDPPQGLILDVTGCAHLWGGEGAYLKEMVTRLQTAGYTVRAAMADSIGAAWAITRYGAVLTMRGAGNGCTGAMSITGGAGQGDALFKLPPEALRLEPEIVDRLHRLGLRSIGSFAAMPRTQLRRRFGPGLLQQLDRAFGLETETIQPVQPPTQYQQRLPCLEPIVTATGIAIAITPAPAVALSAARPALRLLPIMPASSFPVRGFLLPKTNRRDASQPTRSSQLTSSGIAGTTVRRLVHA